MKWELRLEVPATVALEEHSDAIYDVELDDVRSILRDLCASLAQVPGVRFTMTVEDPIPLSVRRDLVVVMEQLRDVLVCLREQGTTTLDLYEQGVEAQIVFVTRGEEMWIGQR